MISAFRFAFIDTSFSPMGIYFLPFRRFFVDIFQLQVFIFLPRRFRRYFISYYFHISSSYLLSLHLFRFHHFSISFHYFLFHSYFDFPVIYFIYLRLPFISSYFLLAIFLDDIYHCRRRAAGVSFEPAALPLRHFNYAMPPVAVSAFASRVFDTPLFSLRRCFYFDVFWRPAIFCFCFSLPIRACKYVVFSFTFDNTFH